MGQYSRLVRVMEARGHFKNGASLKSQTSRGNNNIKVMMKKNFLGVTVACIVILFCVSVSFKSHVININTTNRMSITTQKSGMDFRVSGSGEMNIDWGDETAVETHMLSAFSGMLPSQKLIHIYSDTFPHTITISGHITHLHLSEQKIISLDVSNNTALTSLYCRDWDKTKGLTSLDVSKNTALTYLACFGHQLTSLDVSKNIALTHLGCGLNQLTSLNVSKNIALTNLWCEDNQLISLDVSKNTALEYLHCYHNQLTSLDVSKDTALISLDCSHNQLISLDLSKNNALTYLYCRHNQLTSLYVSKDAIELVHLLLCNNQLSTAAFNSLFGILHDKTLEGYFPMLLRKKTVTIFDNPGTDSCDQSIVTNKGWDVRLVEFEF